jgi:hypothetical protein
LGKIDKSAREKTMKITTRFWRRVFAVSGLCTLIGASIVIGPAHSRVLAGSFLDWCKNGHACRATCGISSFCGFGEELPSPEVGGAWYWMCSPEQEKRVVMSLFNRYCIRCHGIDGRGVWDIPDVPNFTNPQWQSCRTDGQLARAILEGRGAVMPPWRGTLSLEEAWAMARYVRTFVPGTEESRPDFSTPAKPGAGSAPATPPKPPAGR